MCVGYWALKVLASSNEPAISNTSILPLLPMGPKVALSTSGRSANATAVVLSGTFT